MEDHIKLKPLSPELAQKALEEANEIPEQRDRDIEALRKLVKAEHNLKVRTDDAYLVRFLRSCKYDIEWAFETIQKFFIMKANNSELYSIFRPSSILKTFNQNAVMVLPGRDAYGRRVFNVRIGHWNPEISTLEEYFICLQISLESIIVEEETQIFGIVIIIDLQKYGISHVMKTTPRVIKKYVQLAQEFFPARFVAYHFVNEPTIFKPVFKVINLFLKKEVAEAMRFHGINRRSLHEYIPQEILPQELGGLNPPTDNTTFVRSLLERDDELANSMANYGYF